jgi:integrase/recombinase XerD
MKIVNIVTQYIAYKQSMGQSFTTDAGILKAFCRHTGDISLQSVSKALVLSYLQGKLPLSSFWTRKHTALAGLFKFALARGYISVTPLPIQHPQLPPPLAPYIYSRAELQLLLDAAPACCSRHVKIDPIVIRTLILLLYGACLRISEALSLTINDVDLSKALLRYIEQQNMNYNDGPDEPLFCFQDGNALSLTAARAAFQRLRLLTGIQRNGGNHCQPRLHDLRHTGVVHRVIEWYRNGADLHYLLPQLATYLGHVNLSATQHYLSLTPELLREASQRFEDYKGAPDHD